MADMSVKLLLSVDAAQAEAAMRGFQSRVSSSLGAVEARLRVARQRTDAFNEKWRETINLSHQVGRGMQVAGVGIMAAAGLSVRAASNLTESQSKMRFVFKENAGEIERWAATSAESMGLAKAAAYDAAGTFGNFLDALGVAPKPAIEMSKKLIELSADLASFHNMAGGSEEALIALRSGLSGEIEPLRRLGIAYNEQTVKEEALRLGLVKSGETITEAAKVQTRYSLILKQTGNIQGDFARTSDELANKTRILRARFEDIAAKAGAVLIPVVEKLLPPFERVVDTVDRLLDQPLGQWAVTAAAVMGPLVFVLGTMGTGVLQAVFAWNLLTAAQLRNAPAASAAGAANAAAGLAAAAGGAGAAGAATGAAGVGTAGMVGKAVPGMVPVYIAAVAAAVGIAWWASGYGPASEEERRKAVEAAEATTGAAGKMGATHFRTSSGKEYPIAEYPDTFEKWMQFQMRETYPNTGPAMQALIRASLGQGEYTRWQAGTTLTTHKPEAPMAGGTAVDAAGERVRRLERDLGVVQRGDYHGSEYPDKRTDRLTKELAEARRALEAAHLQRGREWEASRSGPAQEAATPRVRGADAFTPALKRLRYEADLEGRLTSNVQAAADEYMRYTQTQQAAAIVAAVAEGNSILVEAEQKARAETDRAKAQKILLDARAQAEERVASAQQSAAQQIVSAEQRVATARKAAQQMWMADQKRRYGMVSQEASQWSGAWGGVDTNMGRWLQGVSERAGGIAENLQGGGRTGGYQQPSAPVTQRTETVTRHVLEIGSDASTARVLMSNRDFRDQLIRLVREQMALERGQARAQ